MGAVAVELDHRAFVVGEFAAGPDRHLGFLVLADHPGGELVDLGDR